MKKKKPNLQEENFKTEEKLNKRDWAVPFCNIAEFQHSSSNKQEALVFF